MKDEGGKKMCVPSLNILRLRSMNNLRKVDLKSVNSLLKSVYPDLPNNAF